MKISRVTITIKKDLLRRIDRLIDRETVKSRSHAIEQLLQRAISKTDINTALIMAGGDGASLRPITYEIPKSMIPVHGKPILEHQINMLKKNGITNIYLAINKKSESIRDHFGNGSKNGVNINYVVEDKPLGTAGALSLVRNINSPFVMLNVDTLIDPDIHEIIDFHRKQNTPATVVLVTKSDPTNFGVVKMKGHQILEFDEKPKEASSNLINAGMCILEPSAIRHITGKAMIKDLFKKLCKENQLSGFVHDGDVFDVGTHSGYEKAIKEWKDVK
jgi:NDP-sugar pyrophosphorylase family protein